MSIIKPTIGRQVWFRGLPWITNPGSAVMPSMIDRNAPMAATIVYAHNDRLVNLDVTDHAGVHWPMTYVTLAQPGDDVHPGVSHATWTAHQLEQTAKPIATPDTCAMPLPSRWPDLRQISMTSELLPGTGQLSARSA